MSQPTGAAPIPPPSVREAESALRRLGYARVAAGQEPLAPPPQFWVQEPGVPRRLYPVFVDSGSVEELVATHSGPRAILVVPDERRAEAAWRRIRSHRRSRAAAGVSILVLGGRAGADEAHWHARIVEPRELLEIATGVVVGLFRRAAAAGEGGQIDFEEMLAILRQQFHIDVERSLGVEADEEALWIMYQLALRYSYAPGEPGANLHLLVLKPSGPAARLPWFAA